MTVFSFLLRIFNILESEIFKNWISIDCPHPEVIRPEDFFLLEYLFRIYLEFGNYIRNLKVKFKGRNLNMILRSNFNFEIQNVSPQKFTREVGNGE